MTILTGQASPLAAQVPTAPVTPTTLAIFTEHRISDEQWSGLDDTIRSELSSGSPELIPLGASVAPHRFAAELEILRGDSILPGLAVENIITVYIHGDCAAPPAAHLRSSSMPPGALGWVRRSGNHIESFIHINCTLLAQVLRIPLLHQSPENAMRHFDLAITRVLLHEWLHIATQSVHHAHSGLTKPEFTVNDLISERSTLAIPAKFNTPSIFAGPPSNALGK